MLHVRTVLFPTDFSACAEHALAHAVALARAYEATLHVLHVRKPGEAAGPHPWPEPGGLDLRHVEREGEDAAAALLAYAEEHAVDVIAMGTHGRTGFQKLMIGSVAEKTVRLAPCPVLAVPHRARELKGGAAAVERVLAPVDFSEFGRAALVHARELAALFDARLDVLHIVQQATLPAAYGLDPMFAFPTRILERSREGLADFVREAPGPEVPIELHVELGYPALNIVEFARQQGSDLIVMATHGLTGLKHFLIGSVAERVVREAPCAVFTVRSFGRQLLSADVLAQLKQAEDDEA